MGMQPQSCRTALYMRLSKDDENIGESSSIQNQRGLLLAYAHEHQFHVVTEYVDDGYSGTDFSRPAFQQMIRDIEDKKIDLVLTKDLSRLGRDYIQTGQYTEVFFPSKKVRYIAVNDGYDSQSPYTDIAPFKNVMNEMYARDASKKIRSALAIKLQNGCFIGNFAPYGYQKDPENKNHLVPDEEAAAVVRSIFLQAANGVKPADIASQLNGRYILPPALYRCAKHPHLHKQSGQAQQWTSGAIYKILRNPVYIGHMAQGKTTRVSFKSKLTLRNAPQDWIIVKNTHMPLVSEDCFTLARKYVHARVCAQKGGFCNLFSGLAKCADCGRNMSTVGTRKKGSPANLACGGYKLRGAQQCTNHFIDYRSLYELVLRAVNKQVQLSAEQRTLLYQRLCSRLRSRSKEPAQEKMRRQLQDEAERLDRVIAQLYEDHVQGVLSEERFCKLLQLYEQRSAALAKRCAALKREAESAEDIQPALARAQARLAALITHYTCLSALDAKLLFTLIDRIDIYQGTYEKTLHGSVKRQTICVRFRFSCKENTGEIPL